MLRVWLMAVLAALLAVPAHAADKEYDGADAGYLVYSVGTLRIGMDFAFPYRRTATADGRAVQDWKGKIQPRLGGAIYLKIKNPDFTGEETGHVVIRRLPPGAYQVGSFTFGGSNLAGTHYRWSPAKPVAMPFAIRSGEATYIGSFMRSPSLGTPLERSLGAAGYFIIANREDRDLPIARARLNPATRITAEVTDVTSFGSLALRSSQP